MNQEFQVVLMAAGRGSRYTELCTKKQKALLPIGNQPLIYFPILQIERAGFKEAILVCLDTQKGDFQTFIDSLKSLKINLKIELVGIPSNDAWGTADSLRHIKSRIKTDILVISCDLISDMDLNECINIFRLRDASAVVCFADDAWPLMSQVVVPGPQIKIKDSEREREFAVVDKISGRLIDFGNTLDLEGNLSLDYQALKKHKDSTVHFPITDLHVYVLKKWLFDYLAAGDCCSVKNDFIPLIITKQNSNENKKKGITNIPYDDDSLPILVDQPKNTIYDFATDSTDLSHIVANLSMASTSRDRHDGDIVRIYAYKEPKDSDAINIRVNTLLSYCYANKIANRLLGNLNEPLIHLESKVQSTQICTESRVAAKATVEKKTSLTRTYVGPGSLVLTKTRLEDCIVMNEAVIEEGCTLTNCIICDNCRICSNTILTNCLVGNRFNITTDSNHRNEVMTPTMELD